MYRHVSPCIAMYRHIAIFADAVRTVVGVTSDPTTHTLSIRPR